MMGKRAGVGMTGHKGLFRIMKPSQIPASFKWEMSMIMPIRSISLHKGNSGLCQAMFRIGIALAGETLSSLPFRETKLIGEIQVIVIMRAPRR